MQRVLLLIVPALVMVGGCDEPNPDDDISPVDPAAEADEGPAALASAEDEGGRRGGKGRRLLQKLDTDGDGAISIAEAEGHFIADKFAKIDGNGDGLIAAEELAAMRRHGGKHGGKHGKKSPEERAAKMLERLDSDGDGAISQPEAATHERIAEKFAAIDADSDGKLTKDELIAFKREHHRKHRGEHRGEKEGPVAG